MDIDRIREYLFQSVHGVRALPAFRWREGKGWPMNALDDLSGAHDKGFAR